MNLKIDSLDVIQQLKKGDIIFHPGTNAGYSIDQVCDDFFIISDENEPRSVRMIYFSRVINEKWEIIKSNIQPQHLR